MLEEESTVCGGSARGRSPREDVRTEAGSDLTASSWLSGSAETSDAAAGGTPEPPGWWSSSSVGNRGNQVSPHTRIHTHTHVNQSHLSCSFISEAKSSNTLLILPLQRQLPLLLTDRQAVRQTDGHTDRRSDRRSCGACWSNQEAAHQDLLEPPQLLH